MSFRRGFSVNRGFNIGRGFNLSRFTGGFRRLTRFNVGRDVDRTLQRTCLGRIANLMSLIFIAGGGGCCLLTVGVGYALRLHERLPPGALAIVGVVLLCVVLLVVIVAGIFGEFARRLFWKNAPRNWFRM